jgi:hypothetical protein
LSGAEKISCPTLALVSVRSRSFPMIATPIDYRCQHKRKKKKFMSYEASMMPLDRSSLPSFRQLRHDLHKTNCSTRRCIAV